MTKATPTMPARTRGRTFPNQIRARVRAWSIIHGSIASVSFVVLSACAAFHVPPSSPGRAASGVPDHFIGSQSEGGAAIGPNGEIACRNPLIDPRNGTRIILVQSSAGEGDYEVPPGTYGVGQGEVLRVECATGRVIGIFERQ